MEKDRRTAFNLDDIRKMEAATKDNAQPEPKPPFQIERPQLAPPGASGIRLDRMPPPRAEPSQAKRPSLDRKVGKPSDVHREFKPLAQKSPDKRPDRGR